MVKKTNIHHARDASQQPRSRTNYTSPSSKAVDHRDDNLHQKQRLSVAKQALQNNLHPPGMQTKNTNSQKLLIQEHCQQTASYDYFFNTVNDSNSHTLISQSPTFQAKQYTHYIEYHLTQPILDSSDNHLTGIQSVTIYYHDTNSNNQHTDRPDYIRADNQHNDELARTLSSDLQQLEEALNNREVKILEFQHSNSDIGTYTHYFPINQYSNRHTLDLQYGNEASFRQGIEQFIYGGLKHITIDHLQEDNLETLNNYQLFKNTNSPPINLKLTNKELAFVVAHEFQHLGTKIKSESLPTIQANIKWQINHKDPNIEIDDDEQFRKLLQPAYSKIKSQRHQNDLPGSDPTSKFSPNSHQTN